jgi:3-methylcrotonyl-CoA carboxylase alpha subunit
VSTPRTFRRILIANRGEIAVRIIRTCREMGIESIAVHSDADAGAPHVTLADHAFRIGPPAPADSYLSIPAILEAMRTSGAEAVHPGYGFLSENAGFASACAGAGVVFIGPPAQAIERMGSKIAARQLAEAAGVPVVPGHVPEDQGARALQEAAARIGFPLLLKPSAGGGGIGMKAVHDAAALPDAAAQARREAIAAFGDGTLYVERLVEQPRHVEFQILADHHGHIVHLFERECSIQRRHQKVLEETPSPAVSPALRRRMGEAAVAVARAAGYRNAGTIEFLLDGGGDAASFYFLEMNTRLQVEHPITEQVTGIDLVRAQIEVAANQPLRWSQEDLHQRGHAIEVRIYAEDPARQDLPQAGPLLLYREPSMPGIRVDSGVREGGDVSVHYDPLLAKLIASAETREAAIARAAAALRQFPILGIHTNIGLLLAILGHPRFAAGAVDTHFLDGARDELLPPPDADVSAHAQAVAAAVPASGEAPAVGAAGADRDPWSTLRGVRV